MNGHRPPWLEPAPWARVSQAADEGAVATALSADSRTARELAILLSPAAGGLIEPMARRALALTRRHFGKTISLYVPLYLSDHCSSGCAYCGFASDRKFRRRRLETDELLSEMDAIKRMGFEEILLLTGERSPEVGFDYLRDCVALAAARFHNVAVEAFAMAEDEYRELVSAGCSGITLYQETYNPVRYAQLHRWGPKRDYLRRLDAPARALAAGIRTVGLGVLLGLADPVADALCLFQHLQGLRRRFWQGGFALSFPRVQPQRGDFKPAHPVDETFLARMIFAFRICLPDVPLVLSTRESPEFRDGLAGVGVSKMSVASRTTVGGYHREADPAAGQFVVSDTRDVGTFCAALRGKGLEPVFKNWDAVYSHEQPAPRR